MSADMLPRPDVTKIANAIKALPGIVPDVSVFVNTIAEPMFEKAEDQESATFVLMWMAHMMELDPDNEDELRALSNLLTVFAIGVELGLITAE